MYDKALIDEIKAKNPILEVAQEYFPFMEKKRDNLYMTHCIHGKDEDPSLAFYTDTQTFCCFGCGAGSKDSETNGSDVVSFIQWIEGCTFQQAIKKLAKRAGVSLPDDNSPAAKAKRKALDRNRVFWKNLQQDPETLNYFKERGLTKEEIDKWRLGATGGKPKRAVFAIMNEYGETIGFGFRRLIDESEGPKYFNSPTSAIFNKRKVLYGLNYATPLIRRENFVVIVEGYFDVISLQRVDVPAVGTMGTAFTDDHAELIKKFTNNVILFFDGDEAGVSAIEKATVKLQRQELNVKVVNVSYKDPDDIVKIKQDKTLDFIKEEAVTVYQYQLNKAIQKYSISIGNATDTLILEAGAVIQRIQSEKEKIQYINQINQLLGADYTRLLL